jgi:N-acetylglutamate synthase-like GNAT family acetyltransferase
VSAPIEIRAARISDAECLAGLISQMGHSVTREGVEERMPQVLADELTEIVVAEGDGRVVGCAVLTFRTVLHRAGLSATLALLVVDEAHRGRGIGARLVAWVESRARERGAKRLTLTSGLHRVDAHRFYRCLGFESTGLRFARDLD